MGERKHTPGPWNTHRCDDTLVVDGDGNSVAEVAGNYSDPNEWPIMEANARLIAAAPQLLCTLKALLADPTNIGVGLAASILIAKAEAH